MQVLSVNVSLPKEVAHQGKFVSTGIFKEPVSGRIVVRQFGLEGDGQADRRVHGGIDMAVYAYPVEHYEFWEQSLGRGPMSKGQFGENLTVQGLLEEGVRVGDIFRIGGTLMQVTQPRIPCYKLGLKMKAGADFPARFLECGKLGFYLRVLQEGEVGAGDIIELVDSDKRSVTIAEFVRTAYVDPNDAQMLKRVLGSRGLSGSWRVHLDKMLRSAEPTPQAEGWEGFRGFVIERKVPESETITSFYLGPADGAPLPIFLPGQFLTFRLEIPGQSRPAIRTYSLSDSPKPNYYRISVKRETPPPDHPELPPGLSSNYFHDALTPGARLCAKAPRGHFRLDPHDTTPVVLLSAGVGLTPMISMLNAIVETGNKRPVWFIHGARSRREHAFADHVRDIAARHDNVRFHFCYSRPGVQDVLDQAFASPGHLSMDLLRKLLPQSDFDFYLCGPPAFMESLHDGLTSWGVSESRIHYEFFGPATVLNKKAATADRAQTNTDRTPNIEVSFVRSGVTAIWDDSSESILDLAEAHGLRPDFSCRMGICHTCMCALIRGEVEYACDPIDLPDPGSLLICCAKPRTHVVIDV